MRRLSLFLIVLCAAALVAPPTRAGSAAVVISEVYPGGGNTQATYANDFVELFNRTASVVSFTGWSIGYSSRESTTWRSVPLRGSINPYHYFLVKMGSGGNPGTSTLPTPDVTGSINVARTGGKVRLYNGSTTIDLLGFGAGVNGFEGKAIAAPTDNTHSLMRINAGCTDTNNNASDFRIRTPGPRNKTNHGYQCSGGATPSPTPRPSATPAPSTNRPPVLAAIGAKSVQANKAISFTVSASDPDRDPLTYSAAPVPSRAAFTPSTRTFEWNPTQEHVGTHNVTFKVSDGKLSDSEVVPITVKPDPYEGRSEITLEVSEQVNRIAASGTVAPPHPDAYVTVKLFRHESREWRREGYARIPLDDRSAYTTTFPHPMSGRCLVSASFSGDEDTPPARIQKEIRC